MKLAWLEAFLEVASRRSISAAAKARGVSRSALSRHLTKLERWVGLPLCERGGPEVRLTPGGAVFRVYAEGAVRRLYEHRAWLRETAAGKKEMITIAASQGIAARVLPGWLRSFEARFGLISYYLITDSLASCVDAVTSGRADFLLCYRFAANVAKYRLDRYRHMATGRESFVPVSVPGPGGRPYFDLEAETRRHPLPLLLFPAGSALTAEAYRRLESMPAPLLSVAMESDFPIILKAMTLEARGLAWLALSDVRAELASGALCRAGGERWDVVVDIGLHRQERTLSRAAENLWSMLAEASPGRDVAAGPASGAGAVPASGRRPAS